MRSHRPRGHRPDRRVAWAGEPHAAVDASVVGAGRLHHRGRQRVRVRGSTRGVSGSAGRQAWTRPWLVGTRSRRRRDRRRPARRGARERGSRRPAEPRGWAGDRAARTAPRPGRAAGQGARPPHPCLRGDEPAGAVVRGQPGAGPGCRAGRRPRPTEAHRGRQGDAGRDDHVAHQGGLGAGHRRGHGKDRRPDHRGPGGLRAVRARTGGRGC